MSPPPGRGVVKPALSTAGGTLPWQKNQVQAIFFLNDRIMSRNCDHTATNKDRNSKPTSVSKLQRIQSRNIPEPSNFVLSKGDQTGRHVRSPEPRAKVRHDKFHFASCNKFGILQEIFAAEPEGGGGCYGEAVVGANTNIPRVGHELAPSPFSRILYIICAGPSARASQNVKPSTFSLLPLG